MRLIRFSIFIVVAAVFCAPHASTAGPAAPALKVWDCCKPDSDRVLWKSPLHNGGSVAVVGDKIIVGDSNWGDAAPYEARVLCLSAATGKPLWKISHKDLQHRVNAIPGEPVVSRFTIDGDHLYYISNRSELMCVNVPDGAVVWKLDMMADLGIFPRDVGDAGTLKPSAIVVGDMVYCITGNGAADDFATVPRPDAPSFLAVNKHTGKVVWSSSAPGKNIIYGQWSQPALAVVDGTRQILFPGGDGILYSFSPDGTLLWKIACPDPTAHARIGGAIVAPPVVDGEMAYVTLFRDFELRKPLPIYAIDLRKHEIHWKYTDKDFCGTAGVMARHGNRLYAAGYDNPIVAIDTQSGREVWRASGGEEGLRSGVLLFDGKLFTASEEGVLCLNERDGAMIGRYDLGCSIEHGSPVTDGKHLFVACRNMVWALRLVK